jgi:ABC-type amino acid transport substrate-binding protein
MMQRILITLGLALSLFGVAQAAPAPLPVLRVGVENLDYYPFYASDGKRFWGYARDLLDSFAQHAGYQLVYEPLPTHTLFELFLHSQRLDLKFPDNPRWSVEAKRHLPVHYSDSLVTANEGLIVRKAQLSHPVSSLRTIGMVRGFTAHSYQPYAQSGQLRLVEAASLDGLLQDLAYGRIDGVYAEFQVARLRLKLLKLDQQLAVNPGLPVDRNEFALSSIRRPEVVTAFNRFLRGNPALVRALKHRYGLDVAH